MVSEMFGFEKSKVIQALRYHFISRKEIRYLLILVNAFAIISALLFYLKKVTPLAFLLASSLWVILMLVFWFILPYLVYKRTRMFSDRFRATLDSSGLELGNEKGRNSWTWSQFTEWKESPYFIHLYFSERAFFILPKEAFTAEQMTEVRGYCREQIRKRS